MATVRPIKVMRIIARLNVGGPSIHVILLTRELAAPAFESLLIAGTIGEGEGDMAYLAAAHGVMPLYLPELGRELSPLRDVMTVVKLVRIMRRTHPDVVHTHTAKAGFVGRVAATIARVPVRVHTFHGHVFSGYFGPVKTRLFISLERMVGRFTHRLITISPALRDELVSTYKIAPASKFEVIPLGLDFRPFQTTSRRAGTFRESIGVGPDQQLIAVVGRLVPIKNHALFLQMAGLVHEQRPAARFAIVGDGELRSQLESTVNELGLGDIVVFAGWRDDLPAVYSDVDVVVISSDNEGTPVSILEALAAGTPVVSTAVGGVPDLLENGSLGRLVPPGDHVAMAEAIVQVLDEPPSNRTMVAAQIADRYSITRLADDLTDLYRRLLAERRPSG